MGWMPTTPMLVQLRRRVRDLRDVKWDWNKIGSYELEWGIFE